MPPLDIAAVAIFFIGWLFFEPLLPLMTGGRGVLNDDMVVIRGAWMQAMARRDMRLMDSQFLGHTLNSASFFGSANLIVIAAVGGVLFGGETAFRNIAQLELLEAGPRWLFELKLALVVLALARGLLDFIWSIRQMNYSLAAIGALPDGAAGEQRTRWGDAIAQILNPALRSFSRGVRAYYFALAAVTWMVGPVVFIIATVGAIALLAWRQSRSGSARGVRQVRALIESEPAPTALAEAMAHQAADPFKS